MALLIFGELITSNSFFLLLQRSLNLFVPYSGLGIYSQGIPISNIADFFWGTNAGIRTTPILVFLTILQGLFGNNWVFVFFSISLLLPFLAFFLACKIVHKPTLFTIIGAIFYGGNVWIINRLFTGFWQLNIVYSLLPFLIIILLRIGTEKNISLNKIFFFACFYAVLASIVLTSQPHFLIIIGFFAFGLLWHHAVKNHLSSLRSLIKFLILTGGLFVLLNTYFLIPGIFFPEPTFTAPNQYFSIASLRFNDQGSSLQNILRFDPLGFSATNSSWGIVEYLQLFPLALFVFLFFLNKKKNYIFLCLVIILIFFSKGINPPFTLLSTLIYQKIFFMHYFRDSSRFLGGVALFSSLSIGLHVARKSFSFKKQTIIALLTVILFLLVNIHSFQHIKTQVFKNTIIPASYISMQQYIANNLSKQPNARLLVIPNSHGLTGYSWYHDVSPSSSNTIFDAILPLNIQLANSTNYPDNYSNQMSSFIYEKFTQNYDSNYLNLLGINYILLDTSIQSPLSERNISTESAKYLTDMHYTLVHKENNLLLFKTPSASSLLSTSRPIFAIGNLNTVLKINMESPNTPVILLNQPINNEQLNQQILNGESLFVDVPDPAFALTCEQLTKEYNVDILTAGWDYDKLFTNYEPYKMTYVKKSGELFTSGRAVSSSISGSMSIKDHLNKGSYIVLIKALTQNKTSLTLTINNTKKRIPLDTQESLEWQNLGTISITKDMTNLSLTKDTNDFIVIDQLLLVPIGKYHEKYVETTKLLQNMNKYSKPLTKNYLYPTEILNSFDDINLKESHNYVSYLASYGKYWKSDKASQLFISNGYAMTFISKNSGIKRIYYLPNYVFMVSLVISGVTLIIMCVYLTWQYLKRK